MEACVASFLSDTPLHPTASHPLTPPLTLRHRPSPNATSYSHLKNRMIDIIENDQNDNNNQKNSNGYFFLILK
jgi:hypothetical protein